MFNFFYKYTRIQQTWLLRVKSKTLYLQWERLLNFTDKYNSVRIMIDQDSIFSKDKLIFPLKKINKLTTYFIKREFFSVTGTHGKLYVILQLEAKTFIGYFFFLKVIYLF